jgi:hypothetical protein
MQLRTIGSLPPIDPPGFRLRLARPICGPSRADGADWGGVEIYPAPF